MLYNLWGGKAIFPFSKIKAVFVGLPTSKTTPVFHNSSNPLPVAGWPHLELFWEIFPLPQDTWNHVEQLRLSAVIPLLSVCILPFFLRTSSLRERQNKSHSTFSGSVMFIRCIFQDSWLFPMERNNRSLIPEILPDPFCVSAHLQLLRECVQETHQQWLTLYH